APPVRIARAQPHSRTANHAISIDDELWLPRLGLPRGLFSPHLRRRRPDPVSEVLRSFIHLLIWLHHSTSNQLCRSHSDPRQRPAFTPSSRSFTFAGFGQNLTFSPPFSFQAPSKNRQTSTRSVSLGTAPFHLQNCLRQKGTSKNRRYSS